MGFMINDDRFLMGCLDHWEFGVDNTGNLLDLKNMDRIKVSGTKTNNGGTLNKNSKCTMQYTCRILTSTIKVVID